MRGKILHIFYERQIVIQGFPKMSDICFRFIYEKHFELPYMLDNSPLLSKKIIIELVV